MTDKHAYEQRQEAQLKAWKAEIDKLKAKAEKAEADARLEYAKQIEMLEAKRDAASQKLQELRESGQEAWQDVRLGVERAWRELGDAVKSAASKLP